jgi:5,6-dimethylbenzimidazole synthase
VSALWLAARARGIGIGWVSILEPANVAAILEVPPAWSLVAYLCVD